MYLIAFYVQYLSSAVLCARCTVLWAHYIFVFDPTPLSTFELSNAARPLLLIFALCNSKTEYLKNKEKNYVIQL